MPAATKQRTVYDVVPGKSGWDVKHERDGLVRQFDRKTEAVAFARGKAKGETPSQLRIHKGDGRIQTEHTYGNDPARYPG